MARMTLTASAVEAMVMAMVMAATAVSSMLARRALGILTRDGILELMAAAGAARSMLLSLDSALAHYLDELYFEGKRLAGKRMVVIKMHDAVFDLDAGHLNLLAISRAQDNGLPNGDLLPVGHELAGDLLHEVAAPFAISLDRTQTHSSAFALFHFEHGSIKAGDHLAGAHGKLDRCTTFVTVIELGSVVKRAHVVGSHLLANRKHALTFPAT